MVELARCNEHRAALCERERNPVGVHTLRKQATCARHVAHAKKGEGSNTNKKAVHDTPSPSTERKDLP